MQSLAERPFRAGPVCAHGLTQPLRPPAVVAVLWQHGPEMLGRMTQNGIAWPRFSKSENGGFDRLSERAGVSGATLMIVRPSISSPLN